MAFSCREPPLFPATLLSSSGDPSSLTVSSSCIRSTRSKFRAIGETGGSNQVPVSLLKFTGAGAGVSIATMEVFYSLVSTLLVSLILGKVLRDAFKVNYYDIAETLHHTATKMSIIPLIIAPLQPAHMTKIHGSMDASEQVKTALLNSHAHSICNCH